MQMMQVQPQHIQQVRATLRALPAARRLEALAFLRTQRAPAELVQEAERVHAELCAAEKRRHFAPAGTSPNVWPLVFGAGKLAAIGGALWLVGCIAVEGFLAVRAFVAANALVCGLALTGIIIAAVIPRSRKPTGTRQADTQGPCPPSGSGQQAGNIFVNINVGNGGQQANG